jgi:hypothetical protein
LGRLLLGFQFPLSHGLHQYRHGLKIPNEQDSFKKLNVPEFSEWQGNAENVLYIEIKVENADRMKSILSTVHAYLSSNESLSRHM